MEKFIQIPESAKDLILSTFRRYRKGETICPHIEDNMLAVERWLELQLKDI